MGRPLVPVWGLCVIAAGLQSEKSSIAPDVQMNLENPWMPDRVRNALKAKPRNVLLIYVDDLKVKADAFEKTPAQDLLRAHGVSFTDAHAQFAECGPSRTALMTSLRPDMTHVWGNKDQMREFNQDMQTLPQWFRENGYETQSIGKVFHGGCGEDTNISWSVDMSQIEFNKEHDAAWEAVPPTVPDDDPLLPDGQIAKLANESLVRLNTGTRPFFLAVGFKKPHLPFVFPERFLDMYPEEDFVTLTDETLPEGAPDIALFDWKSTLSKFQDLAKECEDEAACDSRGPPLSPEVARELRRAYYASATWSDSLVYGLLGKLQELRLWRNTLIVYVSDHGWKLGDYNSWAKQTLWNVDMRTPLIISAPEIRRSPMEIDHPMEHIDVAPTLVELCGLDVPEGWQGKSWAPYLWGTSVNPPKSWAFGQQQRNNDKGVAMGTSITTRNWKYIEWPRWSTGKSGCRYRRWQSLMGRELYRVEPGFDPQETVNQVNSPEYAAVVDRLQAVLHEQFPRIPCTRDEIIPAVNFSKYAEHELEQLDDELRLIAPTLNDMHGQTADIHTMSEVPTRSPTVEAFDDDAQAASLKVVPKGSRVPAGSGKGRARSTSESRLRRRRRHQGQRAHQPRPHAKVDDLFRAAVEEFGNMRIVGPGGY